MAKAQFVLKDGRLLTRELEEQLAAEAEAGYDLSEARRVDLDRGDRPEGCQPVGPRA